MKLGVIFESLIKEATSGGYLAYHGSPTKIDKFVDEFVGGENATDQNGPGIYFTTNFEEAWAYGEYHYEVRLAEGKFADDETSNEAVDIDVIRELIMMAPEWEDKAMNWSPDPEHGVWEAAAGAIEYNDNEKDVFLQVWIDFYRYDAVDFVRNMVKLGYDGIVINRWGDGGGKHIIVYNPSIIQLLNVQHKDDSTD